MGDKTADAPTNTNFFGVRCLLLFAIDGRHQPEYACFDAGLLVQTVCLAAHARGLGTCIMAMAVGYPDVLREIVRHRRASGSSWAWHWACRTWARR